MMNKKTFYQLLNSVQHDGIFIITSDATVRRGNPYTFIKIVWNDSAKSQSTLKVLKGEETTDAIKQHVYKYKKWLEAYKSRNENPELINQ